MGKSEALITLRSWGDRLLLYLNMPLWPYHMLLLGIVHSRLYPHSEPRFHFKVGMCALFEEPRTI